MATITTKYSIGDTVYLAGTITERKQHPCPDCQGTKKWSAKSPAGSEYTFACPRCAASYKLHRDLALDYTAAIPSVSKLTIGSVQFNSAPGSCDHGARYMCRETGIGSGSVYNEDDLFLTEDEAFAASKIKAELTNSTVEWVVTLYNKSLKISDYQLDSAALLNAKAEKGRASSLLWNLGDLFGRIQEASSKDEILEAVEEYRKYDWDRDKEKVARQSSPIPPAQSPPHVIVEEGK